MGLRPIDFQVMLNGMSHVSKKEQKEKLKRSEKKQDEIQKNKEVNPDGEPKDNVEEVETNIELRSDGQRIERYKERSDSNAKNKDEEKGPPKRLDSEYKGNFLDITE